MFGSSVLDLVVGLVYVFLLISLVCSQVSDKISQWLRWRAKDLEDGLRKFIIGDFDDLLKSFLNDNPVIKASAPEDTKFTKFLLASPLKGWVYQGKYAPVVNIPASTFVLALFNTVVPGASGATTIQQLRQAIEAWQTDSKLKPTLLSLITPVDEKIDTARKNVENWFNNTMTKTTLIYSQHMWGLSFLIAGLVAFFLNVDAISLGTDLWQDSALRATVAAAATKANDQTNALEELNRLNLPIGYQIAQVDPTKQKVPANIPYLFGYVVAPKDWVQPAKPDPANPVPLRYPITWQSYLFKIVGWVITMIAGAQGAPFWFDLLRKLTQRN